MNLRYAQLARPVLRRSPLRAVAAGALIVAGLVGTAAVVTVALASTGLASTGLASTGLWEAFLSTPDAVASDSPVVVMALLSVPVLTLPAAALAARFGLWMSLRQVCSVTGRFRWALYGRCLAASVVVVLVVSVPFLLGIGPSAVAPADGWPVLLLVVVCLVPLQAFAEELLFRGVLAHLIGAWWARRLWAVGVSAVVTSVAFASVHLPPSPALFLTMVVGGVAYSVLCDRTGGLEASTAAHTAWNLSGLLLVVLMPGAGSADLGPSAVIQLLIVDVALVVTLSLLARRIGVATTCPQDPMMAGSVVVGS